MNRDKTTKIVADFSLLFLGLALVLSSNQLWAQTRFSTDPVSPQYFYWLILVSLSFVQGALNGLLVLVLRNFKHEYAGTRWTQAFWAGFPSAFLVTQLLLFLIDLFHDQTALSELSTLGLSLWFALFLILNFYLVFRLSVWAAHEN